MLPLVLLIRQFQIFDRAIKRFLALELMRVKEPVTCSIALIDGNFAQAAEIFRRIVIEMFSINLRDWSREPRFNQSCGALFRHERRRYCRWIHGSPITGGAF